MEYVELGPHCQTVGVALRVGQLVPSPCCSLGHAVHARAIAELVVRKQPRLRQRISVQALAANGLQTVATRVLCDI